MGGEKVAGIIAIFTDFHNCTARLKKQNSFTLHI